MKLFLPLVKCDNFVYRSVLGPYMSEGPVITGTPSVTDSVIFDSFNESPNGRTGRFNSLNNDLRGVIAKKQEKGNYKLVNEKENTCIGYNPLQNVFEKQPCDFRETQSFSEAIVGPQKKVKTDNLKSILKAKTINEAGKGVILDLPDNHSRDTLSNQINDLEILKAEHNDK